MRVGATLWARLLGVSLLDELCGVIGFASGLRYTSALMFRARSPVIFPSAYFLLATNNLERSFFPSEPSTFAGAFVPHESNMYLCSESPRGSARSQFSNMRSGQMTEIAQGEWTPSFASLRDKSVIYSSRQAWGAFLPILAIEDDEQSSDLLAQLSPHATDHPVHDGPQASFRCPAPGIPQAVVLRSPRRSRSSGTA